MSTEYAFVCHDCKLFLNLGDLCDASLVIDQVMKQHEHHDFVLGEDSDDTSEYLDTYEYKTIYDNNGRIKDEYIDPLKKISIKTSDGEVQGNYHFYNTDNFLIIYRKYRISSNKFERKFCSSECKERYEMQKHGYGLNIDRSKLNTEFFSDGFVDMINESHKNNVIANSYPEFIPKTNDGEKIESIMSPTQLMDRLTEDEYKNISATSITHRLHSVINKLKKHNIEIPEGANPFIVYQKNIEKMLRSDDPLLYVPIGKPVNQSEVLPGGSMMNYPFESVVRLTPLPADKNAMMFTLTVHKSRNNKLRVGNTIQLYHDNGNFVLKGFLKWKKRVINRQKLYNKLKSLGRRK